VTVLLVVLVSLLTAITSAAAIGTLRNARRLDALDRRLDGAVHEAVAAALAEDRQRELEEARAFWAEQETRAAEDDVYAGSLFPDENLVLLPAPRGYVDDEGTMDPEFADALRTALEDLISETDGKRPAPHHPAPHHPSLPGFVPQPTPTPEWTDLRLMELVDVGTELRDVRPGPMGTLDVYVFEDETTLCVAPGDPAAGARIREAVTGGTGVRLLGSSRLPGGHALTFALGGEETAYVLADRVVASL